MKLRVLDLFSGIGGFSLGLERTGGFETVAFCEIEDFPRKVLAKHWPDVPCFQDVRELTGEQVGAVDVICGGYPCQPFSTAGKRRGQEDDRHLWPEFNRLVAELRPTWVIGENVAGHISMGLDDVLSDLEGQGYSCRTFVIPACAVAAHHRRDRCWTVAHSGDVLHARELDARTDCRASGGSESCDKYKGQASHGKRLRAESCAGSKDVADTEKLQRDGRTEHSEQSERQISELGIGGCETNMAHPICDDEQGKQPGRTNEEKRQEQGKRQARSCGHGVRRWAPEPDVGRVVAGVPDRVDRLKALGNAVVPQIPEMIGHAILESMTPITAQE